MKQAEQGLVESVEAGPSKTYLLDGAGGESERVVEDPVLISIINLYAHPTGRFIAALLLAADAVRSGTLLNDFRDALYNDAPSLPLFNGDVEGFRLVPSQQYPQHDFGQPYVLQHLGRQLLALRRTAPVWMGIERGFAWVIIPSKYILEAGEHPFACDMLEAVRADGLAGLYRPTEPGRDRRHPRQRTVAATTWVRDALRPNPRLVAGLYPFDEFDFTVAGAYGLYNWEVFFHVPLLVADRLSKNGRFENAQKWFHAIFDPTDVSTHPSPQKYWRVKPLFQEPEAWAGVAAESLEAMMRRLWEGDDDVEAQVTTWRNDPFNPHRLARLRLVAYMKVVVQKYIENLTAWADSLFRRDTMESINEATQLYVLANHILGDAPVIMPPRPRQARSYAELSADNSIDKFANDIEASLPVAERSSGSAARSAPAVSMLYFCIPSNPRLQELKSTIADRLFKIRHCMDIDGRTRQLALFAPPIDPALLVRARAAGLDIGTALDMALSPSPHYRFHPLLQKALEFCNEVRSFGAALLSALEKRDGEKLSQLRARHEVSTLKLAAQVKKQQIDEAEKSLEAAHASHTLAEERLRFYSTREFVNAEEQNHLGRLAEAHDYQMAAETFSILASISHVTPDFIIGVGGGVKWGGSHIGNSMGVFAQKFNAIAAESTYQASRSAINAGHIRRKEDWDLQAELARRELNQIDQQIAAAQIRLAIAEQDLRNHERQIAQSEEVESLLRDKFTNAQLYSWMSAQLSALHYQAYRMAFDLAKQAEAAADFELGTGLSFIQFNHWDSGRKGLLAGEHLAQDLRRLDLAYMQRNTRRLEVTSHISLRRLAGDALWVLRAAGSCQFDLPAWVLDLDFPGLRQRRIKSVSISVPGVVGPYVGVHGILRLTTPDHGAIATSSGQGDAGLFQLDFRDERYLPFEGVSLDEGGGTTWRFTLPQTNRPFDYATISDVVLHVQYTAEAADGASELPSVEGQYRQLVSVRHDFPAESRQLRERSVTEITIDLDDRLFPYLARNRSRVGIKWLSRDDSELTELGNPPQMTLSDTDAEAYFLVEYTLA